MKVSLIIPAYNEAKRIRQVIEAGIKSKLIDNLIVVDDGSTDQTAKIISEYDVFLIKHKSNLGKGQALETGVDFAKSKGAEILVFLDADLRNIKSSQIDMLVEPVLKKQTVMTIGTLDRSNWQKVILRRWGALSGQRALTLDFWKKVPSAYKKGFEIEAALNVTARRLGIHHKIKRVELQGVGHTGQFDKKGLILGLIEYFWIYSEALVAYTKAGFDIIEK